MEKEASITTFNHEQLSVPLATLFDGWSGYNTSLVHAITPLTPEQLAWRPAPPLQSVGEVARHISLARISWFRRMDAPGSTALVERINDWAQDGDGNYNIVEDAITITEDAESLARWLNATWNMIEATLTTWTIADVKQTYRHTWNGQTYAVSRQWTLWRILSHDLHHGGELALLLGLQGIDAFELKDLFGHIVLPPLAT
jgi:uncharacterized damage-inducible protein DinB